MSFVLRRATALTSFTGEMPEQRTYIVLGVPRGGTSMAAGALRLCDVFFGNNLDEDNNEDKDFLTHGGDLSIFANIDKKNQYLKNVIQIIKDRNINNNIWGWKDPSISYYINDIIDEIRNPFFVFVMRDNAAIVMREQVEIPAHIKKKRDLNSNYYDLMVRTNTSYKNLIDFVSKTRHPVLWVSYERALRYSSDVAEQIALYAGKTREENLFIELVRSISSYIVPDKISGRIDAKVINYTPDDNIKPIQNMKTLAECYQHAAMLLNSKQYEKALMTLNKLLSLRPNAYRDAPQLASSLDNALDIDAGLSFMKAIALANLGEAYEAFYSIVNFTSFAISIPNPKKSMVSFSLIKPAKALLENLSKNIKLPQNIYDEIFKNLEENYL